MATYTWVDFTTALLRIGRAEVLVGDPLADESADLELSHVGVTEEPIQAEPNDEYNTLTLPEHTGPAPIQRYYMGEAPILTFNLIAADQASFDLMSPSGHRGAGYQAPIAVVEKTLALIPTDAIMENNIRATLAYTTAGGWTVGGDAATAAQLALIDVSMWFWRVHFKRGGPLFTHDEGGKAIIPVTVEVMQDFNRPQGDQLYTVGDPADVYIDISQSG